MKSTYLYSLLLLFTALFYGCRKAPVIPEYTIDNLKYIIVNNEAVVIGYDVAPTGDLFIPEAIKLSGTTYPVLIIESETFKELSITSITMPSIKLIGSKSFYNCTNLTSVNMPKAGCCFDNDTYSSSFSKCPWQPSDNSVISSCP